MVYWYIFLALAFLAGVYFGYRSDKVGDGGMAYAIFAMILCGGSAVLALVTGILQLIF